MREIVLIGGGEHARVVLEVLRAAATPCVITGYISLEDQPAADLDIPWLGGEDALKDRPACAAMLAFGSLASWAARHTTAQRLHRTVQTWATVVHRTAWVSPSARLGEGTIVMPGAIVHTGAVIGPHAVVNSGAVIEHDCRIGENVHIAPRAVLGGGVAVGDGCYIGLGAAVRDHIVIGRQVIVGVGAAVVSNIDDGRTVKGVPARE